jgi:hypothetical protein
VSSNLFYFAPSVKNDGSATGLVVDQDVGYATYDFRQGQATDGTAYSNMLKFNVYSDQTFTNPTNLVVSVVATISGGGSSSSVLVPIASINGEICGTGSNCFDQRFESGANYYFGARYSNQATVTVGLYLNDICIVGSLVNGGGTVDGCNSTAQFTVPTSGGTTVSLTFYVGDAGTNQSITTGDSATARIGVYNEAPTLNTAACPSAADPKYYPGDSEIYMDTSQTSWVSSGTATIDTLILLGKLGASAPTVAGQLSGANDVVARQGLNQGTMPFTGFQNKTGEGDLAHDYSITFLLRNAAGVLSSNQCATASGVQTAPIQTLLNRSKCFIATGAFRSPEAEPVMMLRAFRDQFLLHHAWGKSFVRWYYAWSPDAATWLMENPEFRGPVLMALLPLQAFAWLVLHPAFIFAVAISWLAAAALTLAVKLTSRRRGQLS